MAVLFLHRYSCLILIPLLGRIWIHPTQLVPTCFRLLHNKLRGTSRGHSIILLDIRLLRKMRLYLRSLVTCLKGGRKEHLLQ